MHGSGTTRPASSVRAVRFFLRQTGGGKETVGWRWGSVVGGVVDAVGDGMGWQAMEEKRVLLAVLRFLPLSFRFLSFPFFFRFPKCGLPGDRALLLLPFSHGVLGCNHWLGGLDWALCVDTPGWKLTKSICIAMDGGGCDFAKEDDELTLLNF